MARKSTTRQVTGPDGKPARERVPYDANGRALVVGDTVRSVAAIATWGNAAELRRVEAIGTYEHLAGYVTVTGILGWCKANRFEKVQP